MQELARADNSDEHWKREQSNTPKGHNILFNTIAAYDTCTVIHADIAADMTHIQVRSRRHWLAIEYGWGGRKWLIVNCHMPTSWSPAQDFEDAVEKLRCDIVDTGGNRDGTITVGLGDMNIP